MRFFGEAPASLSFGRIVSSVKVWFLQRRSSFSILILTFVSLLFLGIIEFFPVTETVSDFEIKQKASEHAYRCFQKIKALRIQKGLNIDPNLDPSLSGLIGVELSSVTSSSGKLTSKQASVHPDFAIWFVDQFLRAGLKKDDEISAGISGSFPALNIAFYSAADAMGLRVNVIGSVSSSQYGANLPEFLWPEWENFLFQEGLIFQRAQAYSTGGIDDQGIGIDTFGVKQIRDSIKKNGYRYLSVSSFEDSLIQRIHIYEKSNVRLYVNVGGGTISTGTSLGKKKIPRGLVWEMEESSDLPDSILKFYLEKKIPILHVIGIETISEESGMVYKKDQIAKPGTSNLLYHTSKNRWLSGVFFLLLVFMILKFSPWIPKNEKVEENTIHL
ncbi:poly-gamma-glutamate system protein [Leptospira stimsonii]|uniref:Poly-gamma-glutamate system protein n=1 Tax=Leptospira stimsonii TaxID=2202203 RepID=A0ABY2N013_9LEPT|nr:poly-gamma-glutamate system protein [Leptospira stimsonii]TGM13103.1 poly-gamma-glutamate system protein [Leptospira stimsonii]